MNEMVWWNVRIGCEDLKTGELSYAASCHVPVGGKVRLA